MKKTIVPIIILTTIVTNFVSIQSLNNKKIKNNFDESFQLQLVINNSANNIIPPTYFYLDININNKAYNNSCYILQNKDNVNFLKNFHAGKYNDTFTTNVNSKIILYTLNLVHLPDSYANWDFTFGTFVGNVHYPLTSTHGIYTYDYYKNFLNTGNNGTKIVIDAFGSTGANDANWGIYFYKF